MNGEAIREAFASAGVVVNDVDDRTYVAWRVAGVRHELGVTGGGLEDRLQRLWTAYCIWRTAASPIPQEEE